MALGSNGKPPQQTQQQPTASRQDKGRGIGSIKFRARTGPDRLFGSELTRPAGINRKPPTLPLQDESGSCYAVSIKTGSLASASIRKESAMSPTRIVLLAPLLLGSALLAQQANPASFAAPASEQIARWVKLLGHDDFAVREEATARLAEAVEDAEDALREAAKSQDAEVARRANLLLEQFLTVTLQGHSSRVHSVSFSPDGKRIVSADLGFFVGGPQWGKSIPGKVKVWDAKRGSEAFSLKGHTGTVYSVAFSPDGKRIVGGSGADFDHQQGRPGPGEVKVWDADKGTELLSLKGHSARVSSVAYSPDGKRIVSASEDKTVKVWDAVKGTELFSLKGHTNQVISVAYSPDGKRIVSASMDATAKVWDAVTGQEVFCFKGHSGWVCCVRYSPDGTRIASAGEDKTVKVWDAVTGKESLSLNGHSDGVSRVSFSPDGKRLASASDDQTVKVWHVPKQR